MDRTEAKIGRLMKKRENTIHASLAQNLAGRPFGGRSVAVVVVRVAVGRSAGVGRRGFLLVRARGNMELAVRGRPTVRGLAVQLGQLCRGRGPTPQGAR